MDETSKGQRLDFSPDPPEGVSWQFFPKRKGAKISALDMIQELFCQGMDGNLYVQLHRVPGGYPVDEPECLLYEPEDAIKILAGWCRYTVLDSQGDEIT